MVATDEFVIRQSAGCWLADLSPLGGPVLGPYRLHSEATAAAVRWLEVNY